MSFSIAILVCIASGTGIFYKDFYQDSSFAKAAWFTNDIITLLVAVPLIKVVLALDF
ncbi:MAG: hypothetical protein V4717_13725 [Bacteroidota bacterium]